jgi:glycosyltransferase involved in cell wall biosynthesis
VNVTERPRTAPVVSIIIPAFNAEKYIAESVESIVDQSHPSVECIVVDDGSTDRTAEIVAGFGDRVHLTRQANAERSAARNAGLAQASGEYVGFLDADDLLLPGKVAEQVTFLEAHPEYDVVYSLVKYFREEGKDDCYTVRRPTPSGDILPQLIYTNFITMNSPLFRKAAVKRVAGFDVSLSRYEDWDFLLRLALTGSRFGFVDSFHALCRMHGENTVKDQVRMFEAKLTVAHKIVDQFAEELDRSGIDRRGVVAFHQADFGRKLILAGQVAEGRRLIADASRCDFPHRQKFLMFSLAAGLCGYHFVALMQRYADSLLKYRRVGS